MPQLTIVGLGPGSRSQLTLEAWRTLRSAEEVHLRTGNHPLVTELDLPGQVHSLDHLYEDAADQREAYEAIVSEVMRLARRPQGATYAIPGHPLVGEATVRELLHRCQKEQLPVRIVDGLSFVEPALTALGLDALGEGLHIADALSPSVSPALPSLFAQLHHPQAVAGLKAVLLEWYPPDHPATLVAWPGVPGRQQSQTRPLVEIDQHPLTDGLACLYLPPLQMTRNLASFENLVRIVERLRAPDGCPWDQEQTHASLRPHLLEEAYEALEALDVDDHTALCEELGDLLLQIALHAQIAAEGGEFSIRDVVRGISTKIVHRHPHVFGDARAATADEVRHQWEELKRDERAKNTSALAGVPAAMPALAASRALQERAARIGLRGEQADALFAGLPRLVERLRNAADQPSRLQALGELLFSLAGLARHLEVDPEEALREADRRFRWRFAAMEESARRRGMNLSQLSPDHLEALWREASQTP